MRNLKELFSIQEKDLKPDLKYKIYCDMDGVLTDFDSRFEHFTGLNPKDYVKKHGETPFWDIITEVGEVFWTKMEWMRGGKQLWDFVKDYDVSILSSPSREESSRIGKKKWVEHNLGSNVDLILAYSKEKQKYANKTSILIDDRSINIKQWKSAGGIGIPCRDGSIEHSIQTLKQLGYE